MDKKSFKNQVLRGLLCCQIDHAAFNCKDCPYTNYGISDVRCIQQLLADAYKLINKEV